MTISNSGQFKKGNIPYNKGIPCSEEHKKKQSESMMGRIPWNKGKKGIHFSPETEFKKGEHCGIEHFNYKGGKKLKIARQNAKRRELGTNIINKLLSDDMVTHHLTEDFVAYIPEFINKSVSHNVRTSKGMDEVNFYALNYLFLIYNKGE